MGTSTRNLINTKSKTLRTHTAYHTAHLLVKSNSKITSVNIQYWKVSCFITRFDLLSTIYQQDSEYWTWVSCQTWTILNIDQQIQTKKVTKIEKRSLKIEKLTCASIRPTPWSTTASSSSVTINRKLITILVIIYKCKIALNWTLSFRNQLAWVSAEIKMFLTTNFHLRNLQWKVKSFFECNVRKHFLNILQINSYQIRKDSVLNHIKRLPNGLDKYWNITNKTNNFKRMILSRNNFNFQFQFHYWTK